MPWNIIFLPALAALVYGIYKGTSELNKIHSEYESEEEEKDQ